jgi:hypothetical protein
MRKQALWAALVLAAISATAVGVLAWRGAAGGPESPITFPTPGPEETLLTINGEPISAWSIAFFEANGFSRSEALDFAIDGILKQQLARRFGLQATDEEAEEYLRDLEASWSALSEEARLEAEALLRAQGLPTSNIDQHPRWLAFGRQVVTGIQLGTFLQKRSAVARLSGVSPDSIANVEELAALEAQLDPEAVRDAMGQFVQVTPGATPESEEDRLIREERAIAEIIPNPVGRCTISDQTVTCVEGQ